MSEFQSSIILSVVSTILCPVACAAVMWLGRNYWANREQCAKDHDALHIGVQALLRDRILQGCRYYEDLGYTTHNARVNLTRMHEAYEGLGGNSIETHEYQHFMELPHKTDDKTYEVI